MAVQNYEMFKEHFALGELITKTTHGEIRKCLQRDTESKRAVKILNTNSMDDLDIERMK